MRSLNSIILTGNLASDPKVHTFASGKTVTEARFCWNTSMPDGDGGWKDKPNFADLKVAGPMGEALARTQKSGARLALTGFLEIEEWDSDQGKRSKPVIRATQVEYVPKRQSGEGAGATEGAAEQDTSPVPF